MFFRTSVINIRPFSQGARVAVCDIELGIANDSVALRNCHLVRHESGVIIVEGPKGVEMTAGLLFMLSAAATEAWHYFTKGGVR